MHCPTQQGVGFVEKRRPSTLTPANDRDAQGSLGLAVDGSSGTAPYLPTIQIDFGTAPDGLLQGSGVHMAEEALSDEEEPLPALLRGLVALLTTGEKQKGRCHLSREEVREMVGVVQKMEKQARELADKVSISFKPGQTKT